MIKDRRVEFGNSSKCMPIHCELQTQFGEKKKKDWNSKFLGVMTALLSLYTWETHLQDATHSLLLLTHRHDVNFLFFQ